MMYKIQRLWSTLNETSLGCWLNNIMDVLDLKKFASEPAIDMQFLLV